MKTLFLIRHAKSSWKEKDLDDFERPLNERGKRDAPFMAELLNKENITAGLIITSPARRAIKTAKIFAAEINFPENKIAAEQGVYMAGPNELLKILQKVNNEIDTVMLFGHNPGLTELVNYLSEKEIDNVPTCGIVRLELKKETWNKLEAKCCILRSFEYPRKYS